MQLKVGGKLHLKLNTGERPIANKYREGKMKSTLERELKQYVKLLKGKRLDSCHVHCEFNLRHGGGALSGGRVSIDFESQTGFPWERDTPSRGCVISPGTR